MAINFPSSPTTGQTYAYLGDTYQWDGTHWTSIGGNNPGIVVQAFTANGTYTASPGLLYAMIECIGSGAGGAGIGVTTGICGGGGGGGAGGYSRKLASAPTIGTSQTVTVGLPGTGGATGANPGTDGANVSVGTICMARGGSGGAAGPNGLGGAGGQAGTGDITGVGGYGQNTPNLTTACVAHGGSGGSTFMGSGAKGPISVSVTNGVTGTGYGGGGSGGCGVNNAGTAAGGDGARGVAIITEYIGLNTTPLTTLDNSVPRFNGVNGILQTTSNVFIDDSDRLLIGSSTALPLMFNKTPQLQLIQTSGQNHLGFASFGTTAGSDFGIIEFARSRGTSVGSYTVVNSGDILGLIRFSGSDGTDFSRGVQFWAEVSGTAGSGDMPTDFVIGCSADGTEATAEVARFCSAGGIKFPASQRASSDANSLDDYEEGTFTPTLTSDGTQPTQTPDAGWNTGWYTKIGRNVTFAARHRTDAFSGGSGGIYYALPFQASASEIYNPLRVIAGNTSSAGFLVLVESMGVVAGNASAQPCTNNLEAPLTVANCQNGADKNQVVYGGTYIV